MIPGGTFEGLIGNGMRAACWNVLDQNADAKRILRFLDDCAPTVAALQEVTAGHVSALRAAGWAVCLADDFARGDTVHHLALVSRPPLGRHRALPVNADRSISASLVGRRMGWAECLEVLTAAWDVGGTGIDVTCLHLSCAVSPSRRARERETILAALPPDRPAIVMGDFNAFGRPWLSPLAAPVFGIGPHDLARHELRDLHRAAQAYGLRPVVDGVTYPRFRLQLDQVLVRGLDVDRVQVLPEPYGSDHRPILVDVRLPDGTGFSAR